MSVLTLDKIVATCRLLFPWQENVSEQFIEDLRLEDVKLAYREIAKIKHPDKARKVGVSEEALAEQFKHITMAYQKLCEFINSGERPSPQTELQDEAQQKNEFEKDDSPVDVGPPWSKPVKPSRIQGDFFYRGRVPFARLRFGRYLYYRGLISWHTLLRALNWQKHKRPSIGEIALQFDYLSSEDLDEILYYANRGESFGKVARAIGKLHDKQVLDILEKQAEYRNTRIGDFLVEENILTRHEIDKLLGEFQQHNRRLEFLCQRVYSFRPRKRFRWAVH